MKVFVQTRDVYRYHHSELRWDILLKDSEKDMLEIHKKEMAMNVNEQFGGIQVY